MQKIASLFGRPAHIYVIGDFGRAATFQFCNQFINYERKIIEQKLGKHDFYDEYRISRITVESFLPEIKDVQIRYYISQNKYIDEKILIGFPGGMLMKEAVIKFCKMLIKFILNIENDQVLKIITLPCNTLSPALLELEKIVKSPKKLQKFSKQERIKLTDKEFSKLKGCKNIKFITVAESVIEDMTNKGFKYILPLGTSDISNVYTNEVLRCAKNNTILKTDHGLHHDTLEAIKACIKTDNIEIDKVKSKISKHIEHYQNKYESKIAIIEACTDLKLGIGYNSLEIYAEYIAKEIYNWQ